jgi:predicted MFS family arabinose efflux permease
VLQLNPIQTGVAMVPMTAVILVSAPLSSYLAKFFTPKRIIQLGIIFDLVSFLVLRQSLHLGASQWALAPGFVLFGFGMGLIFGQASNLTLSAVSVEQSGEASGVNNTLRSLGQTLGSAVLGAILISSLSTNLVNGIKASTVIPDSAKAAITQAVSTQTSNIEFGSGADLGSQIPASITKEITTLSHQATIDASKGTLSYGLIFILLTLLLSFKLPNESEIQEQSLVSKQAGH